jgi:hypothetical protein
VKKGTKVTTTGRIVVSDDGKSRTVTSHGTDAQSKKYTSAAVYDQQQDRRRKCTADEIFFVKIKAIGGITLLGTF